MSFKFYLLLSIIVIYGCSSPNNADDDPNRKVRYTHELITDELEYPWQLGFSSDGRIFLSEVKGKIRVVEKDDLKDEPWFDVADYMKSEGLNFPDDGEVLRAGLQGLAVDPDFENNGYIYAAFAYEYESENYDLNRLIRLKEDPETKKGLFDKVFLDKVPGNDLHQGGQIKFGPDNKLYWSIGDRFNVETAQDLEDLSGSILRMNADGSIPADNPFHNSYIYSYGHRNPQGFDWHPETGIMMATEHGPSSSQGCCRDEINIIEKGKNYGWPEITGDETAPGMETPIIHSGNEPEEGLSSHDSTWAPSGASFVKSGPWEGTFLFGGLRSQSLWQLVLDDDNPRMVDELKKLLDHEYHRVRSVEQAEDGGIYMITSNRDRIQHVIGKDFLVRINVFYEAEEAGN